MKITKEKRKKLLQEYERLEGLKYVKGIKEYPPTSLIDWVGYMSKNP